MQSASIVRIVKGDIPGIVELYNQDYAWLTSSRIKLSNKRFEKWLSNKAYEHYCLKYKNKIVALMFIQKKRNLFLKAILVDKHWRRKGFASLLTKKAIKISKKLGKKLNAEVLEGNQASLKLLTKLGFKICKTAKQNSKKEFVLEYETSTH